MNALTFVYLNVVNGMFTGAEYELYSGYYQAYLRKNGICTNQYISTAQTTAVELATDIVKCSCGRIVFFVGEYNYYITKIIVNLIRNRYPEIGLIAVGSVAEYIMDKLGDDFPVDCFCTGNEYSQLLAAAKMPNLSRNIELPSEHVGTDEIPHPYSAGVIPAREAVNVGLIASRGCIGKCNFCSYETECMTFSPESVAAELRFLYGRLGAQNITLTFFDECFGITTDHAIKLCQVIAKEALPYKFFCWCRLDMLTDELLCSFSKAGFHALLVGLESASERVLERLGKLRVGDTPREFLYRLPNRISFAEKLGIKLMASINFGLDGEETIDAAETIRYAEEHHLQEVSINYMTIFPKSRLYPMYAEDPRRVSESPTRLPLRTFYPTLNMRLINNNKYIMQANTTLTFREDVIRELAVDYYCNVQSHGEGIVPCSHRFTSLSQMQLDEHLILGGSCLVSKVDSLKYGRLFSDERKPLKCEVEEYDANLRQAYKCGVYIENQMFLYENGEYCSILVNQAIDSGRFRFRYFGTALEKKIALLLKKVNDVQDGCVELSYDALPDIIFDDMGAFLSNCCGQACICSEQYSAQDVQKFYAAWGAEPLLSVYASVVLFLYKNKRLFGIGGNVFVYFHSRFKAFGLHDFQHIVIISAIGLDLLYDTRGKHLMALKKSEKALLLNGADKESATYQALNFKLRNQMGIWEYEQI